MSPSRSCPNSAVDGMPKISNIAPPASRPSPIFGEGRRAASALDQRAAAFLERAEGFRGGDGGAGLVEVAGVFRLGGLLHFEQIRVVNLAAVGAHDALAKQRIVGRQ